VQGRIKLLLLIQECHKVDCNGRARQVKTCERHRQLKSTRSCASGIDVKNSIAHMFSGLMGVTADDDSKPGCRRIEIQSVNVVKHVKQDRAGFGDGSLRQGSGPFGSIHVSAHGNYRRESVQGFENLGPAYVTGVNDEIGVAKGLQRLRAK